MYTGIIITAIICVTSAAIAITAMVQDYMLKKEKIKADAMIMAEEIKAKNQLEIEKYLYENNNSRNVSNSNYSENEYSESRTKNKERV